MKGSSIINTAVRKTVLTVTPFLIVSSAYLYLLDVDRFPARAIGLGLGCVNLIAAAAIGGWASKRSITWAAGLTLASFFVRLVIVSVAFAYLISAGLEAAQVLISFAASTTVCLAAESVFLMASKE